MKLCEQLKGGEGNPRMGYFSRNTEWNNGFIEADVDQDREKRPSLLLWVGAVGRRNAPQGPALGTFDSPSLRTTSPSHKT